MPKPKFTTFVSLVEKISKMNKYFTVTANTVHTVKFTKLESELLYEFVAGLRKSISIHQMHLLFKGTPRRSNAKDRIVLLDRDGSKCFYCGEELGEDITIEHLIPLQRGGLEILENKVLTHGKCNVFAGHKTLREKIKLVQK